VAVLHERRNSRRRNDPTSPVEPLRHAGASSPTPSQPRRPWRLQTTENQLAGPARFRPAARSWMALAQIPLADCLVSARHQGPSARRSGVAEKSIFGPDLSDNELEGIPPRRSDRSPPQSVHRGTSTHVVARWTPDAAGGAWRPQQQYVGDLRVVEKASRMRFCEDGSRTPRWTLISMTFRANA
jgi:hypothetical protein